MRTWILFVSFMMAGNALASNDQITFLFEDGYAAALLYIEGGEDGAAAKLYERMKHVNAVDEGVGMAKGWREQLFQWKCIAKTTGEYSCKAKFYSSHSGTHFDINGRALSFHGGPDFAQAFVRDRSGFGLGVTTVSGTRLEIRVYRENFELNITQ